MDGQYLWVPRIICRNTNRIMDQKHVANLPSVPNQNREQHATCNWPM